MRSRLSIRCDLIADESVPSWISRLAACNRVGSAYEFCLDMGLSFQACVRGRADALGTLSELTGTPLAALERASLIANTSDFMLRKEHISRRGVRRSHVHACPLCLCHGDDLGDALGGPVVYGRTMWQLSVIRTCPKHGCALVAVAESPVCDRYDFTTNLRGRQDEIRRLAMHPLLQCPSSLETYVTDRLEGRPTEAPWLDGLELSAAITTCELLGVSLTLGTSVKIAELGDPDLHRAGHAGFAVARHGEPSIRAALSEIRKPVFSKSRKRVGRKPAIGVLYKSITQTKRSVNLEPVHDLLRRHIIETTPVGPGDIVLGQPVEKRVLHSLATAAQATGRSPVRLRTALAAAGLIDMDHARLSNHRVVFDAERARPFLEAEIGSLDLTDLAAFLKTSRRQSALLANHGYIRHHVEHYSTTNIRRRTFARREIDALFERFYKGAEARKTYESPIYNLIDATRRCRCNTIAIVELILENKLSWVGRDPNRMGYESVLVDTSEVKRQVKKREAGRMTVAEVSNFLTTSAAVVKSLARQGYLTHDIVIRSDAGQPMMTIDYGSAEKFKATYVSLIELTRIKKMHHSRIRETLVDVMPAIDPREVKATFYRRDALPNF